MLNSKPLKHGLAATLLLISAVSIEGVRAQEPSAGATNAEVGELRKEVEELRQLVLQLKGDIAVAGQMQIGMMILRLGNLADAGK